MSKRISDAQIYGLLWARDTTYGVISELHNPPHCIELPNRRLLKLHRTAFDRFGLLGLGRRGFMRERKPGLWEITDAGRAELERPVIVRRIDEMVKETAERQRQLQEEFDP